MASLFDLVGNYDRANNASMKRQLDGAKFNQGVVKQQGGDFTKFIKSANSDLEADALGIYKDIQKGARLEDMDNKPAGFETTEDFKTWYEGTGPGTGFANKKYSNLGDTDLSDYVSLYGHKGTFRKLNEMGFGTALLGPDKQFDPDNSTIRQNPETGEMEMVPYVRTNSEARKQSYSAPMTVGGKDIRETITQFGPEAAEEAIVGLSMGDLNTVFQEYARDVEIGGGGNPAISNLAPMTDIPWGSPNRKAIEDSIETRVAEKEDTSTTGGEDAAITQGNTAVDPAAAVDPMATSTPPAPAAETVKTFDIVDTSGSNLLSTVYNEQRKGLGPDFYMGPGDAAALNTQLENTKGVSANQRALTVKNYKKIAAKNLDKKIGDQALSYFGGLSSTDSAGSDGMTMTAGGIMTPQFTGRIEKRRKDRNNPATKAELELLEKNGNWYKTNKQKLIDRLKGNSELYNEFVQDPDAFVARYVDDKNFFPKPIAASDRKAINNAGNNTGIKIDTKAVVKAVETGDLETATNLLVNSVKGKSHSKEDDQAVADVITKYNGNFAELDKARRVTLAAELLAGMPDDKRDGNFANAMINMIETGDMTMTTPQAMAAESSQSSSNTARLTALRGLSKDADDLLKPDTVSNAVTKIRNEIIGVNSADPLPITSANILDFAGQVSHLINGSKRRKQRSPQEHEAALGLGLTVIDKYYEINAQPTWFQELITLGYAIGPQSGGFNLSPDVRGYDVDGEITLVPNKIVSFGEPGMNTINLKQIETDLGKIGMNVFYDAFVVAIAEKSAENE